MYHEPCAMLCQMPAGGLADAGRMLAAALADWVGIKSKYFLLAVIACGRTFDSTYAVALDDGRVGFSAVVRNMCGRWNSMAWRCPACIQRCPAVG